MTMTLDIPRDRWGRPLITPPNGGKPIAYTRASSLGGTLEDRYNLERWGQRQVALGLAMRPDLVALTAAKRDDKKALDKITEQAKEHALSSAAANVGTALHAYIEQINNGEEPWGVPAEYARDIAAYRELTKDWQIHDTELFVVCDELKVAGTFDFTATCHRLGWTKPRCCDLKTGSGAVNYGQNEISIQLAVYAHGQRYNPATGERTPLGVNLDAAYVVHLVAGSGHADLHRVDIKAGWEAAQLAVTVREWRKRKGLFTLAGEAESDSGDLTDPIGAELAATGDIHQIRVAYSTLVALGHDPRTVEARCRARITEIGAVA